MKLTTLALAGAVAAAAIATHALAQYGSSDPPPAPAAQAPAPKYAAVKLEPRSGSTVKGKAKFSVKDGKVMMEVSVEGLTPGEHAIHLHDKGDCSAADAASAGGHWNPMAKDHGMFGHDPYHHGDIGNLVADAKGKAKLKFTTDQWTIGGGGMTDVVGHSVIVHATADDFKTQPTGNAGGRVACGVIELK